MAISDEPVIFMKEPSSIIGPVDDVIIAKGSEKLIGKWSLQLG